MNVITSIKETLSCEAMTINNLKEDLDENTLIQVTDKIKNCAGKIIISGCGTSGEAAKKIAHTLNCIECPSLFLSPANALHGGLGVVQKSDVVILISKGGNTIELNQMLEACKDKEVTVIGVTENENSYIAIECDILLKIKVNKEPDDFNMLATGSTIAVIATFDSIAIAIMRMREYTKEEFLRIHPGGDVGKRLKEERTSI